jgi:phage-related protein
LTYVVLDVIFALRGIAMSKYSIKYYDLQNGDCPVRDFINSLPVALQVKTYRDIELLKEFGDRAGRITAPIGDGIFELRTHVGNNHSRILYFFQRGKNIVFTNGFIKKTERTPKKHIELAKKYRDDYRRRNKDDEL